MNLPIINRKIVMMLSIGFNLLIGNSFFIFGRPSYGTLNIDLMIIMSLVTVLYYIFFYNNINLKKRGIFVMFLLSVLSCMIIVYIGSFIGMIVTGYKSDTEHNILLSLGVGFVSGFLGNFVMLPATLGMGTLNLFWFYWYRKILRETQSL